MRCDPAYFGEKIVPIICSASVATKAEALARGAGDEHVQPVSCFEVVRLPLAGIKLGRFLRSVSMENGSKSIAATVENPAISKPISSPPAPENMDSAVRVVAVIGASLVLRVLLDG